MHTIKASRSSERARWRRTSRLLPRVLHEIRARACRIIPQKGIYTSKGIRCRAIHAHVQDCVCVCRIVISRVVACHLALTHDTSLRCTLCPHAQCVRPPHVYTHAHACMCGAHPSSSFTIAPTFPLCFCGTQLGSLSCRLDKRRKLVAFR